MASACGSNDTRLTCRQVQSKPVIFENVLEQGIAEQRESLVRMFRHRDAIKGLKEQVAISELVTSDPVHERYRGKKPSNCGVLVRYSQVFVDGSMVVTPQARWISLILVASPGMFKREFQSAPCSGKEMKPGWEIRSSFGNP